MSKTILPLDLESLVPVEAVFRISGFPEDITLNKWTLKIKARAIAFFGAARLGEIFSKQEVVGMAEIVFRFMMKAGDRAKFEAIAAQKKNDPDADIESGLDAFMEAISSPKDQATVVRALIATVGIGEPELREIEKALKHPVNANSPHAIKEDEAATVSAENESDPNAQGLSL